MYVMLFQSIPSIKPAISMIKKVNLHLRKVHMCAEFLMSTKTHIIECG